MSSSLWRSVSIISTKAMLNSDRGLIAVHGAERGGSKGTDLRAGAWIPRGKAPGTRRGSSPKELGLLIRGDQRAEQCRTDTNTSGEIRERESSIACKSRIKRENIVVYDVSATIDQCPTIIEENSPIVLRYKTPYFKASARVVMPPVPRNETWVVGWIQACTQMEFYNTYGDIGMSSWELPELREGQVKAISDSDGVSYPWYGNTTETVTLAGPTSKPSRFTVSMNDNFYPSVTWAVPVSDSNAPLLTRIKRDQSFTTWLVALNASSKEKILLQTIRWRMRVDIAVDPSRPLGARASLAGRPQQDQPRVLTHMEPIPPNALGRPNANDAQALMWRPKRGVPLVVIPPK
ncbi:hypothetical protein SKAU_G00050510 [Synaphobranchus kaupii]|uniref:Protein FAM78B n=1 Tax=Synaphobranchus kaupii TaxID=118154 RepID=A0A9Q1G3C6_SYNKA|nr:hypothetical protein SKAU_G00050510 [Synaphobranchus kaupii]